MVPANTGTEAVEAAIKIARAATGRPRVLYAEHAFHGLTLGSLSLNGNDEFRDGFGPLLPGCDPVAVRRRSTRSSGSSRAATWPRSIVEPVQGKGVHLPPDGYLPAAQRLCRERGHAVRLRRGPDRPRAHRAVPRARALGASSPDLICVAKALSGGFVPIGAVLVSRAAFDRVFDGMERAVRHGSTFGTNDLAAAAALATLRVIERDGVVEHAERWATCCSS